MTPQDRLAAFARRLAAARGFDAHSTECLYARVERLASGYRRGGEWRATAHIIGLAVRPYHLERASTVDNESGVYAHGASADAAVDAAIAEWRERIAWRHRSAVVECESAQATADRWAAIVAAVSE